MADSNRKHRLKPFWVGNNPIGDRTASEPSAVIQIEDTNGGFLTSRLTNDQRDAIDSPADGLMIWNTDTNQMEVFAGGAGGNWDPASGGGGGVGAVNTVFGRAGNVISASGDYNASQIVVVPTGNLTATEVQAALVELQGDINAINAAATTAASVTVVASGNLAATDTQSALDELQGDIDAINAASSVASFAGRNGVVVPTAGDYTAALVTVTPGSGLAATNAQAALAELQAEILAINVVSVINDLTDVDTTTVAPTDGQGLTWDNANSVWVPTTLSSSNIYTADGTLTGNRVVTTGANAIGFAGTGATFTILNGGFVAGGDGQVQNMNVAANLTVTNDATVTGNASVAGNFDVSANADLNGNVDVAGTSTLTGNVTAVADVAVGGDVAVTGEVAATGRVTSSLGIGVTDSGFVTGFAAPTLTASQIYTLPVTDGSVDQVLTTDGSATLSWTSVAASNRVHADDTTIAPVTTGAPTVAEITIFTAAGTVTDTLVYYTGTDTETDIPTHVYWVDAAGTVTELLAPSASDNFITADLTMADGVNRIHQLDGNLTMQGDGLKRFISSSSGGEGRVQTATAVNGASSQLRVQAPLGSFIGIASTTNTVTATNSTIGMAVTSPDDGLERSFTLDNDEMLIVTEAVRAGTAASGHVLTLADPATGRTEFAAGATTWSVINSGTTDLVPGNYAIDSSTAGFTITLNEEVGEWEFGDTGFSLDTNNVVIGTAAQTFTDETGAQVAGPVTLDQNGTTFKIVNIAGTTDFLIVKQPIPNVTTNIVANGSWNAATNTPDLTQAANQGDGTNLFTYLITNTGSVDFGGGSEEYLAGGQITFFDQPGANPTFRYDAPTGDEFEFVQYNAGTFPTPTNDHDLLTYNRKPILAASNGAGGSFSDVYNFNKVGVVDSLSIINVTANINVTPQKTTHDVFAINSAVNGFTATILPPNTISNVNARDEVYFLFTVNNGVDADLTVAFDPTYIRVDGTPIGTATISERNASRYMRFVYDRRSFAAGGGNWVLVENTVPEFEIALSASKYTGVFDEVVDWGAAVGGYYTITIDSATHGIADPTHVQVWEEIAGAFELTTVDRLRVDTNGDVIFRVIEAPNGRFSGRVTIA